MIQKMASNLYFAYFIGSYVFNVAIIFFLPIFFSIAKVKSIHILTHGQFLF